MCGVITCEMKPLDQHKPAFTECRRQREFRTFTKLITGRCDLPWNFPPFPLHKIDILKRSHQPPTSLSICLNTSEFSDEPAQPSNLQYMAVTLHSTSWTIRDWMKTRAMIAVKKPSERRNMFVLFKFTCVGDAA